MAGTSKSALVIIGQGGYKGLQAYNNARNYSSEMGLRQAQINRTNAETQYLPAEKQSEIGLRGAQTELAKTEASTKQKEQQIIEQRVKMVHDLLNGMASDSSKQADKIADAADGKTKIEPPVAVKMPVAPVSQSKPAPVAPASAASRLL